ncbi:MAG: GTPase [bacterium]
MPTNVSPEYKRAEAEYRKAREPEERLSWLKEMLKEIPKHKGTEHLQADIKTRIKELTDELTGPRKGAARTGPVHSFKPEGAAQVSIIAPPNAGKSSLHVKLTGSQAEIGEYPHTTQVPMPGMFPYGGIQFQLIDLPPISATYMESWMPNAVQPADAALLLVDLNVPGIVENVAAILEKLDEKRISLVADWGGRLPAGFIEAPAEVLAAASGTGGAGADAPKNDDRSAMADQFTNTSASGTGIDATAASPEAAANETELALDDPFRSFIPTILVANKCDLGLDPDEIEVLEELVGVRFPAIAISTTTGEGLDRIGPLLFRASASCASTPRSRARTRITSGRTPCSRATR